MRRLAVRSFLVFASCMAVASVRFATAQAPDGEAPTNAPVAAAQPGKIEQTTTVTGTAPDLVGRWLMLPKLGVAGGAQREVPSVWDVQLKDGKPEITERLVVLPAAQDKALQQGNEEQGGGWDPTPADLAAILAAWDTMAPEQRGVVSMTHQITGRDAFDDDFKADALAKDAIWVVRQSYSFESGGNRPITQANLIAPLEVENGVYRGNYLAVTVAAAPFPVPIKFEGTFRLIPLERPAPSAWQRLGDFFAGCNKRP